MCVFPNTEGTKSAREDALCLPLVFTHIQEVLGNIFSGGLCFVFKPKSTFNVKSWLEREREGRAP